MAIWKNLLTAAHEIKQNKRRESLIRIKIKQLASKKLVTLKDDVPSCKNLRRIWIKRNW